MRKECRRELELVESRVSVSALCWIDVASVRPTFRRADVLQELKDRQTKDRRYPKPTMQQITEGRKQAIAEGVFERVSSDRYRSKVCARVD